MDRTIILLESLFQVFSYTFKKHLDEVSFDCLKRNSLSVVGVRETFMTGLARTLSFPFSVPYPITAKRLGVSLYALSPVNTLPVDNFVIKVNQLMNLNRNKYRRNR